MQLVRTAERALADQAGIVPDEPSGFAELSRLALPIGLGAQAALIAEGLDAVAISAAGERPLSAAEDSPEEVVATVLDEFGRSTRSGRRCAIRLRRSSTAPRPTSSSRGNLVPGWTLAVLALALILPALLAAVDGVRPGRAARRSAGGELRLGRFAGAAVRRRARAALRARPRRA